MGFNSVFKGLNLPCSVDWSWCSTSFGHPDHQTSPPEIYIFGGVWCVWCTGEVLKDEKQSADLFTSFGHPDHQTSPPEIYIFGGVWCVW